MRLTTVAILVLCTVACCNAQRNYVVEKMRVVTDVRNGVGIPKFLNIDSLHVLVKLKDGFSANDAVRSGLTVVQKLNDDAIIVKVNKNDLFDQKKFIEHTRPVNYLWKLSENLSPTSFDKGDEYVAITENPQTFIREMQTNGIEATHIQKNLVRLKGKLSDQLAFILQKQDVTYLGKESLTPKEESTVLDLYLGPNHINKIHDDFPHLNGTGIVISLKERHYDVDDLDLRGRHIASSLGATDTSSHATEMATIVAGAGNSFITGKGIASHASITSSDFLDLFPDNESQLTSLNTFLQNHSYGTVVENFYGSLANAYDQQTHQNPKLLHVFSSGNSGASNAASGVYTAVNGFSNLTGNSKMAKNVLIVGSVDTTGNAVPFSSHGPTNDGRIKPEIVAFSTVGTSNSSALVSGVAVLMQQVYKTQYGTYPESALVKALLVNSADEAGEPGIDFLTGFGNLNGYRSIENVVAGNYFEGIVAQNEIKNFNLNVPASAKNLKITLVWNDVPAAANSSKPLINNLDLQVTSSTGSVLPWILNATPNVSSLNAAATRGIDNINNIEQVTITNPGPEGHTVSVRGSSLLSANQKFYIAYQWDIANSFIWNYPTGSDNFPYNGETGTYFYWKSTLPEEIGDLEVSSDNGNTWKLIAKNLNLKRGYYRWQNPSPENVAAKARMNVNGVYYVTEEFTISKALKPTLGFNCSDSVLLQWSAMENVAQYELQKLAGIYPSTFTTQADTARVLKKDGQVRNYSVQPRLAGGKLLLRSPSIDIDRFGAGCFITTFVDESTSDEGVMLRLELGTTYGVTGVTFEHLKFSNFVEVNSVADPNRNVIRFLHADPLQGLNRYRAKISLQNGQEILTDTIQNYFLTKTPFIIFPNPVKPDEDLNIYSGKFETVNFKFELFNSNGMWVRSAALKSDRELISTEGLPPGLYIYNIYGKDVNVSGKIVIK